MKCFRITVTGRVQGVFFRASTKTQADNLGLTGWVKNESDGSVMIEVAGDEKSIQNFIKWCHEGPPISRVDNVRLKEIPNQDFKDFKITY